MAVRYKPLKRIEDIQAVPLDQPVMIDVSEDEPNVVVDVDTGKVEAEKSEDTAVVSEGNADLMKQLNDLQESERVHKEAALSAQRERDAAVAQARTNEQSAAKFKTDAEQAQYDTVINALTAANAEADAAQQALEQAFSVQDYRAASDAQRRISRAEARITQLEAGKDAFEQRREEAKSRPAQTQQTPTVDQVINQMPDLLDVERSWLRNHPDAITNPKQNTRLQVAYEDAVNSGLSRGTDKFIGFLEDRLGYVKKDVQKREVEEEEVEEPQVRQAERRSSHVSAPVSRESVSMSSGAPVSPSRIVLTPAQREAAKVSGVDEKTYAKQLIRLKELKRDGHYGNSQQG